MGDRRHPRPPESLSSEDASEIGVARDEIARLIAAGDIDRAADRAAALQQRIDQSEGLTERDRRRADKCLSRLIESSDPRGYWRSRRRNRLIVIAAGPLANIAVAYLLLVALSATGMPQPLKPIPVVAGIERGFPAQKAGLRTGDRIVSVDGRQCAASTSCGTSSAAAAGGRCTSSYARTDSWSRCRR